MPRPKVSEQEKAKRRITADRDRLVAELEQCSNYHSEFYEEYNSELEQAIKRLNSALDTIEQSGLPEGWVEKWA